MLKGYGKTPYPLNMAKFGYKQRKQPTPSEYVWRVRLYTVVAGVVAAWLPTAYYLPLTFRNITVSILVLTITIANAVLPLFGVDTTKKKVDIEDVGSMEEIKKQ